MRSSPTTDVQEKGFKTVDELWRLSATELAQGIRDKNFSASEVVRSVLDRVAEKNPDLNAITVEFPEEALAAAALAPARGGRPYRGDRRADHDHGSAPATTRRRKAQRLAPPLGTQNR